MHSRSLLSQMYVIFLDSCRVATSGLIDSNDTYSDVMVTGTSLVSSSESFDKDSSEGVI